MKRLKYGYYEFEINEQNGLYGYIVYDYDLELSSSNIIFDSKITASNAAIEVIALLEQGQTV